MLFDNPLSKYLFFKINFLRAMALLSYLVKLKRDLGVAFGTHFLHDFYGASFWDTFSP